MARNIFRLSLGRPCAARRKLIDVAACLALLVLLVASAASAQDVSFEPAVDYPGGSGPDFVAVGDFNSDGAPDLVLANQGFGNVSVLLANGDGTFQMGQDFSVFGADHTLCVAVADFYRRGILDLVVGGFGGYGPSKLGGVPEGGAYTGVWLLRGNGDGTFSANCFVSTGCCGVPVSMAVGDFNGDGVPDVATANHDHVAVLLGGRPPCFGFPPLTFRAGSDSRSVTVGDFNGDGILDLAVANFGSSDVSVLLGNGDGTFQPAVNFDAGDAPSSVAVGKFRGVGMPDDLAVANTGSNNVSVLLGNGDGTFQPTVNFDAGEGPSSVAVSDFNGDGLPDLAVANLSSNTVSVLINNTPRQ